MGLSFKSIGKALKRVARSKVVQGGLSVATGGLSDKVLSVGKALGAAVTGNKMLKKQQKAVTAATEKLRNLPAPGVVGMATGSTGDGTSWINAKTAGSSRKKAPKAAKAAKVKKLRRMTKKEADENTRADAAYGNPFAIAALKKKKAGKKKRGGGGRKPPQQTEATKKKFAANADAMKKKAAAWKKMSDAQKKAAGGWKTFAFGK